MLAAAVTSAAAPEAMGCQAPTLATALQVLLHAALEPFCDFNKICVVEPGNLSASDPLMLF